jgi:hypothetical protein
MRLTGIIDVFLAKIACLGAAAIWANSCCLIASLSGAASMTRSACATAVSGDGSSAMRVSNHTPSIPRPRKFLHTRERHAEHCRIRIANDDAMPGLSEGLRDPVTDQSRAMTVTD